MKKTISKTEAKKQVDDFFDNIKNKTSKEVKKIKRLAMAYNIPLKEKRKLFCKKCFNVFSRGNASIKIKNDRVSIHCSDCGHISRWVLI